MKKNNINKYLIDNFTGGSEYNDSTYIGYLKIKKGGVKIFYGDNDKKILKLRDNVLKELIGGLKKNNLSFTRYPEYFSALEGKYVRNIMCGSANTDCTEARRRVKKLTNKILKGGIKIYGDKIKNILEIHAPILYKKFESNFKYNGGDSDNWDSFWRISTKEMDEIRELSSNLHNKDRKSPRDYKEELKKYLKDNDDERHAYIENYRFLYISENNIPILISSIDIEYKKIKDETKEKDPFCNHSKCEIAKKRFLKILNKISSKKDYEIYAKNLKEDNLLGGDSEHELRDGGDSEHELRDGGDSEHELRDGDDSEHELRDGGDSEHELRDGGDSNDLLLNYYMKGGETMLNREELLNIDSASSY